MLDDRVRDKGVAQHWHTKTSSISWPGQRNGCRSMASRSFVDTLSGNTVLDRLGISLDLKHQKVGSLQYGSDHFRSVRTECLTEYLVGCHTALLERSCSVRGSSHRCIGVNDMWLPTDRE